MVRAYSATTFEQEKHLIIHHARTRADTRDFDENFAIASLELRSDRDAALAVVAFRGRFLKSFSEDLQDDYEVVEAATGQSPEALEYASGRIRNDLDFVIACLKNRVGDPGSIWRLWRSAGPGLKRNKDFILRAVHATQNTDWARTFFTEAGDNVKHEMKWATFKTAVLSLLPCPGEEAVQLAAKLTLLDGSINKKVEEPCFVCELFLMSGRSFTCHLPMLPVGVGGWSAPTLGDLAISVSRLVSGYMEAAVIVPVAAGSPETPTACVVPAETVRSMGQVTSLIGITFDNGDGELTTVGPWDCERGLTEFLPASGIE